MGPQQAKQTNRPSFPLFNNILQTGQNVQSDF